MHPVNMPWAEHTNFASDDLLLDIACAESSLLILLLRTHSLCSISLKFYSRSEFFSMLCTMSALRILQTSSSGGKLSLYDF